MSQQNRDPGCVTSPAPPRTVSCSHPRACSSLWGTGGSDLTDCASPECIQRPRSDQAFPANQGNPASQQHLQIPVVLGHPELLVPQLCQVFRVSHRALSNPIFLANLLGLVFQLGHGIQDLHQSQGHHQFLADQVILQGL